MNALSEPILSAWIVVPMAAVTLLLLAGHLTALQTAAMPRSRRRIRTINGLLMMLVTPLIAYVFCVATTNEPKTFVLGWTAVVWLLASIIFVAVVDAMNTLRLAREERAELRGRLVALRRALDGEARRHGGT